MLTVNGNDLRVAPVEYKLDWRSGCVISVKGLPDECDREAILSAVKAYIGEKVSVRADYSRGMKDGAIRFDQPNDRIRSLANELNEGNVTINDKKVDSASILEGDEEETYYNEYIALRNKTKKPRVRGNKKRIKKPRVRGNKRRMKMCRLLRKN